MSKILIIDDEVQIRGLLARMMELEGYEVCQAGDCKTALRQLELQMPDVALCDVFLPDGNGVDLVTEMKKKSPGVEIILLTAHGNIPDGVQAIKNGAFDYITKGDDNNKIIPLISRAVEKARMNIRLDKLEKKMGLMYSFDSILGESKALKEAVSLARKVSVTDVPVLLTGETGTGKEVFAQSIHNASERRDKPFIAQNCAALPDTLLESILFGTSKGAFTGAMENKGLFELADGGTLFLDEINSMPLFLKSKLLRVLQDGSFRSLGGSETKRTNVKIIAATNVEPLEAIEKGQLRRDIYYRLSMMSIRIPPLRERKADIGHFVKFYVNKHNGTFHKQVQYVSKDLLKKLEEYDWPGNVRELEHVIVYGMSMVDETSSLLQYKDIKGKLLLEKQADRKKTPESLEEVPKLCSSLREAVAAYEEKLIWQALEAAHGNISEAARILDVPRQTLQRKASQLRGEKAKEKQEKEI